VPAPVSPVLIGRPVPEVRTMADGVPRFGVVRTALVLKTATPVPVSSESEFKSEAEAAVVVACDPEPRKRARVAVRDEKVFENPERVALVIAGVVRVLAVRVWVPPTVTTEVLLVPAVVTRRSPVPTVRTPVEWVATQSPFSILSTKPVLPKRFCQPSAVVPSEEPPSAAGLRAVEVSWSSAALLIPHPSVFAAGRYMPFEGSVAEFGTNEFATEVVKVPAAGVVAPTVPLILIEAVPVRLVTVPEDGVPRAPLKVTKAPAEPTFTARAVPTPVPRPVIPAIGRPVPLVRVTALGVPRFGVVRTALVLKTATPVPVSSESEFKSEAEAAVVVAFDEASRKSAREAVRDENVTAPASDGVVMVGEVPKTTAPLPVSSVSELARYAETAVVVARADASRKRPRAAVSDAYVI
jgi:hypothetical protein